MIESPPPPPPPPPQPNCCRINGRCIAGGECWQNQSNKSECACLLGSGTPPSGWERFTPKAAVVDRLAQTTESKTALATARKAANFDRNTAIFSTKPSTTPAPPAKEVWILKLPQTPTLTATPTPTYPMY